MALKRPKGNTGTVVVLEHVSKILRGNALADPHVHYGARILSKRLQAAGIAHTYEEFDDNHSDIDYRMDVSLPFLSRALR
jgi:hypothetical protein